MSIAPASVSDPIIPFPLDPKDQKPEALPAFDPLIHIPSDKPEVELLRTIKKGPHHVHIKTDGNVMQFDQVGILEILQDIQIGVRDDELIFSLDGKKWEPYDKLFSFDCGFDIPIDNHEDFEFVVNMNTLKK